MIRRVPSLHISDLLLGLLAHGQPPAAASVSYAGYSRYALLNILRALKLAPGTKVLLPAYICDVVLLPCEALGLVPAYYGITDTFAPDLATVRTGPDTKVMITVNYFGFGIDFAAIAGFVNEHRLIWINDNAHGLASGTSEKKLEEYGDLSVTSFKKVVPVMNGARVRINNAHYDPLKTGLDALNRTGSRESYARYVAGQVLSRLGTPWWPLPDFSDIQGFPDHDLKQIRPDRLSQRMLQRCDEEAIRNRRRAVYQKIAELLHANRYAFAECVHPLLPDGASPLAFPIMIRNSRLWKRVLAISREQDIDMHTWPSLPEEIIRTGPFKSVERWQQLVLLPIHQDMEPERSARAIERVFNEVIRTDR